MLPFSHRSEGFTNIITARGFAEVIDFEKVQVFKWWQNGFKFVYMVDHSFKNDEGEFQRQLWISLE